MGGLGVTDVIEEAIEEDDCGFRFIYVRECDVEVEDE